MTAAEIVHPKLGRHPLVAVLLAGADWSGLSSYVAERFGVNVDSDRLADACGDRAITHAAWLVHSRLDGHERCGFWYSAASWDMWLKNRIGECRGFECKSVIPPDQLDPTVLHVFFISIEETTEHLARLRRNDPTPVRSGPDSPGIARTLTRPAPIDRTAARVFVGGPGV